MLTQAIATVPKRELRDCVASLRDHHDVVLRALDILLTGVRAFHLPAPHAVPTMQRRCTAIPRHPIMLRRYRGWTDGWRAPLARRSSVRYTNARWPRNRPERARADPRIAFGSPCV